MQTGVHLTLTQHLVLSEESIKRLLLACLLGGAVGVERELRHKMSGLRTNLLVCMAAALFTVLSPIIAGDGSTNKGQIASNIVQGVGFLGAGLILHYRSRIHGLTSAATVFVVAAIGMACGGGMYMEACIATVLVLCALQLVGAFEGKLGWQRYSMIYEVRADVAGALAANTSEHREDELTAASEAARRRMIAAVMHVLDSEGIHLIIDQHENIPGLPRISFPVIATRSVHQRLINDLRASNATDTVVTFRDLEDE
ncbi:MgtC/SapB family protein [Granulicella cerasi]|uniref:MgtC/SapB family protein n=1 Tax=Granulicella cerasi TaxID=741063 RepID=A0ABW1ZCT8_9BACT|nr:MgtC/SapB family protein [Granulicella cerasi]